MESSIHKYKPTVLCLFHEVSTLVALLAWLERFAFMAQLDIQCTVVCILRNDCTVYEHIHTYIKFYAIYTYIRLHTVYVTGT